MERLLVWYQVGSSSAAVAALRLEGFGPRRATEGELAQ
jgi:hypothetical protein